LNFSSRYSVPTLIEMPSFASRIFQAVLAEVAVTELSKMYSVEFAA